MGRKHGTTRLTLDLTPDERAQIERLKSRLGMRTSTAVVKWAIRQLHNGVPPRDDDHELG